MSTAIAPVKKSLRINAPVAHAFEVFTAGLARWWPEGHGVGPKPIVKVRLEPKLGGRWLETSADGTETQVALITVWEPPHRVVMLWQINAQWKPDLAMKSEIDVRFTAEGKDATLVELTHHKFETMGAESGAKMRNDVNGGWPGLLDIYLAVAEGRAKPALKE